MIKLSYQTLIHSRSLLSITLTVLLSASVVAQGDSEASLPEVLRSLEAKFKVSFSYQDENVVGLRVLAPDPTKDLDESLQFLSNQSGLQFIQINEQFIAVSKPATPPRVFCGFVVDEESGSVLAGATVGSSSVSTVTDQLGYFTLDSIADREIVSINFLGYEAMYLTGADFDQRCKTIPLSTKIAELDEVVINNYLAEGINKKTDGSLNISTRRLQILPGTSDPDILFTLQALPGIISVNETVSNLNIRGGTNDQNLILWEGIRLYQSGHFFGLISAFNPYFGDDITVIRNGTSASYGNGVSGTIEIKSQENSSNEISGSVGTGFNMINGDINLVIPVSKKTDFKISSRRAITDLIRTPTFEKYFERAFENTEVLSTNPDDTVVNTNDNFYFYDVSAKLDHRFSDKNQVSVSFLNLFNKLDFEESQVSGANVDSKTSGLNQQSMATGASFNRQWSPNTSSSLSGSISKYKLDGINFDIPNDQRLIQENEVLDVNLKGTVEIKKRDTKFLAGYEFSEIGIRDLQDINNPDFRRSSKDVLHTHAVFLEGHKRINDSQIRLGIRGVYYYSLDRTVFEPRLAVSHALGEKWSLELQGELKSQSTAQVIDLQTDFLGVEKRRWILSNEEDIPLIQSSNLSIGANYHYNGLLIGIEAYSRSVDGIVTSSQGFQNQFEFVRSHGSYQVYGGELLINQQFEHSSFWLSYACAFNDYTFNFLTPTQFPNNLDIRHVGSTGFSYQIGSFGFSSGVNYRTGRPTTTLEADPIVDGNLNFSTPNGSTINDYLRVDFSADYQFDIGSRSKGQIRISFWNLTNRKNSLNQFYRIESIQAELINERALEFTPNLMVRCFF